MEDKVKHVIAISKSAQPFVHITLLLDVLPLLLKDYHINLTAKGDLVWIVLHTKNPNVSTGW